MYPKHLVDIDFDKVWKNMAWEDTIAAKEMYLVRDSTLRVDNRKRPLLTFRLIKVLRKNLDLSSKALRSSTPGLQSHPQHSLEGENEETATDHTYSDCKSI
ncbi:hypothetical protein IFM89_014213 [Coptis chinensis]|uniref:Uncharacterized protein n=1 Tax=Coptis chinensis TaxID=261450 RepID=A0A835IWY2_9MAGN|nr:hypothetical protein IFM89_014213 [Coptis chinensis]